MKLKSTETGSSSASAPWTPLRQFANIPEHLKEVWRHTGDEFHELWRSREYEVFVRYLEPNDGRGGPLHLSVKRLDREPVYDWRHKQSIKNEIAGPDREAVEIFPDERRLVDGANQTHLYVLPRGARVPFGFNGGYAAYDDNKDNELREEAIRRGIDPAVLNGGKQRPFQPGLSTGPEYVRRNGWVK